MEIISEPRINHILCCECGTLIEPNPANMCVGCIRTRVDITDGITKQNNLQWCKGCLRYMNHNNQWISCSLESKELLAICLKKLKGLHNIRLVDASFIWTEPHSKRIKVKLIVQKEVNGGAILQQSIVIEFVVMNQMCNDCHRREAKDFWKAVVQIRQKVEHKKTFYYLEQLMLKHNAASNILNIKPEHGGLDFYFASKDDARKFSDFVQTVVPCKSKYSQRLISHDTHNNTFNYKCTFSLEIPPVCKDSVVCLSRKLAATCGTAFGQLVICCRVTKHIHLVDPLTGQRAEIACDTYWANPFSIVCPLQRLTRFVVIDVEMGSGQHGKPRANTLDSTTNVAECWVTKDTSDGNFGTEQHFCRTHLGHLLRPGDLVLGLHLPSCNINDANLETMKEGQIPEVILVKKIYFEQSGAKKRPKRKWKLKRLEGSSSVNESNDYKEFLNDLEEDPELRRNVNIYRDATKVTQSESQMETGTETAVEIDTDQEFNNDPSIPRITLQEMLEDFHIEDKE